MSKPPGTISDLSASDVLAPQFWAGKTERPAPGIELACSRIAIELQNLDRDSADDCILRSLESFRDAASADAAFAAVLDPDGQHIESVLFARGHFAQCHPEALRGEAVSRNSESRRCSKREPTHGRDCSVVPRSASG